MCVVSAVCAVGVAAGVADLSGEVEQFLVLVPLKPCALLLSLAPACRVISEGPLPPAGNFQDSFLKVLQQPTWILLPHETPLSSSSLLEPLVGTNAVPFFWWTCASVISCHGTRVTSPKRAATCSPHKSGPGRTLA